MGTAFNSLKHTKVIHIPVIVEVEVGEHIRGVIEQRLELLYRRRLCKCGGHGLKVQIQGHIVIRGKYPCGSGGHMGLRDGNHGAV